MYRLIVGVFLEALAHFVLKKISATYINFTITSFVLACGSFYLVKHIFHVSGNIFVLFSSMVAIDTLLGFKENKAKFYQSRGFLAFVDNLFIFYLTGLMLTLNMSLINGSDAYWGIGHFYSHLFVSCISIEFENLC